MTRVTIKSVPWNLPAKYPQLCIYLIVNNKSNCRFIRQDGDLNSWQQHPPAMEHLSDADIKQC